MHAGDLAPVPGGGDRTARRIDPLHRHLNRALDRRRLERLSLKGTFHRSRLQRSRPHRPIGDTRPPDATALARNMGGIEMIDAPRG